MAFSGFLGPRPGNIPGLFPGRDPDEAASASEPRLVPNSNVIAGGVTAANLPALLRNARRA